VRDSIQSSHSPNCLNADIVRQSAYSLCRPKTDLFEVPRLNAWFIIGIEMRLMKSTNPINRAFDLIHIE